ncbi:hypothetical protein DPEC_G00319450 [Dallia pectoralis]|uniref:Uncharacterized protein n=1 Tax=Dallia pectoralis TaxID=75939 RepID=A0ACC2F9L2_DALPE|nr:hypothetical protein DPEC_G00319450 [Dallia pectoralis]
MEPSRINTLEDLGTTAMRRGSYNEAEDLGRHPHLLSSTQRRRSIPSLAFEKALGGLPWISSSPMLSVTSLPREEASCQVSAEQCPFVLGLRSENAKLVLDACVQVTEAMKTRERHLFLFSDVLVIAKLKSSASYRLKHRIRHEDLWLYGFEEQPEEEEGGEIDFRTSLVLVWPLGFCVVSFRSPEVKERWLDTIHRKIKAAKQRTDSSSPRALMKVPSCNSTVKNLSGGGMETFIEFPLDGNAKIPAHPRLFDNTEERAAQSIENCGNSKWNVLKMWRKSQSPLSSVSSCADIDSNSQLFGQPLSKICPINGTLPKPIREILVLLRKKGPSTEGVFRKPGNNKNLKAIREQLNSGAEVDMETLPVVLLVGLLKSFLMDLPGRLLISEMFETWMKALETEDVDQLKRVVEKLPKPNVLLLQNILCVLRHIIECQETNKMDAKNLAVCIAPTLLQKDCMVLDVHTVEKVTELTQFLIEHCCEIFGEDVLNLLGSPDEDNLDFLLSQQHDSAYDSTDPDAEGDSIGSTQGEEEGRRDGSFPSLLSVPACHPDRTFHTDKHFSRRQSEPIIFHSAEPFSLIGQARSQDDFSGEGKDFKAQSLMKQTSDDSFLNPARGGIGSRPVVTLSLPKLGDPSCPSLSGSLESAASNASEGSVFTSSPLGSPVTRRAQLSFRPRAEPPRPGAVEVIKRCAQSMKVVRTRSLGAGNPLRGSLKKCDVQKDKSFPCGTLREDTHSEAESPESAVALRQQRPLSSVELFKQVDSWQCSRPPSYEQAVQNTYQPAPPHYGAMTVSAANATLSRKSRPASMNANFQYSCPVSQYKDCLPATTDIDSVISGQQQPVQFRQRTMSESLSKASRHETLSRHETVSRRCSQPVFEEYSYAKESYV